MTSSQNMHCSNHKQENFINKLKMIKTMTSQLLICKVYKTLIGTEFNMKLFKDIVNRIYKVRNNIILELIEGERIFSS